MPWIGKHAALINNFYGTYRQRFWNNVDIGNMSECWNWTKGRHGTGYGCCCSEFNERKTHRVSWIYTFGSIPYGKYVLHRCDNRLCVNPMHLYLGTASDNQKDRSERNWLNLGTGNSGKRLHPNICNAKRR